MRSWRAILAIGAALATLPGGAIHARWLDQQRRAYFADCMNSCERGDASSVGTCDNYCWCMLGETEKAYPDPQLFAQLRQAKDPAYMRRIRTADQFCANR